MEEGSKERYAHSLKEIFDGKEIITCCKSGKTWWFKEEVKFDMENEQDLARKGKKTL